MDINAEVTTQLSLIDALLSDFDKKIPQCPDKKDAKKEEETEDAMPDSTTSAEKTSVNTFHCGDDVFVLNKDGCYYLGTIIELSTSNDNDLCEVGAGVARCLVKFGDGTHSWAPVTDLKLLSKPPVDDGRIMCVVCKRREGPATSPATNAIIACDMCGRGYHAKCHTPPVEAWINGASWHCKRCVEQRFRVAAAENRALRRNDVLRYSHQLTPPCDTASTTSSTASEAGKEQDESHCYCGEKSDWLAQMLCCCRCSRWFHQRCVSSLQYPLYAGDKLYIFACAECNGGAEYLRRLELCWLQLAHLALYNLTAYNAPNYFDLDTVIMPYIMDNWHALQLTEKMWRTPVKERREKILTALTSSRKRFKCGREMKKRATIWGLRLRRPPPPPACLTQLAQIKKGISLSDELVREHAPKLRFLPRVDTQTDCSSPASSSNLDKNLYSSQHMIVPVDGHWLNLMMGKRFHENLTHSENDSTSSFESPKSDELPSPTVTSTKTKDNEIHREETPVPLNTSLGSCSVKLNKIPKEETDCKETKVVDLRARIATMNLEISKMSTKNIIEHSKIMSLQHMDRVPSNFNDIESSSDETSSRGTLDTIIPPLKDFQGKNNPFLMKNNTSNKKNPFSSAMNTHNKQNGKKVSSSNSRFSLPNQLNGVFVRPVKRKLSEKDIIIGPNGEVKRRKFRRPKKYLQTQLNKSCPLPEDSKPVPPQENSDLAVHPPTLHGRRLRQRQEKNYYENARRNTSAPLTNNSVKSLQLSPHKVNSNTTAAEEEAKQLSELKLSVASYFRAEQRYRVLARRKTPNSPPAYLIEWESA